MQMRRMQHKATTHTHTDKSKMQNKTHTKHTDIILSNKQENIFH